MTGLTWHSFDLKSGRRGQQLTVQSDLPFSRIIGEPTEISGLTVKCWDEETQTPVPGWDEATAPGRTMVVAVDDLDRPLWGGMVLRRHSDPSMWVKVDCATLEAYFDRRYVTDQDFVGTPQGAIVTAVLSTDVIWSGVAFTIDAPSATPRDRKYLDDEDKTALAVLQELSAVEGGPEFTVDLAWADDTHMLLNRIVRVRDRIGSVGVHPSARFEMPGSIAEFDYVEDYTAENGANDVMATSSGEGDKRPESQHAVAQDLIDNGWPRFERRFTPSTSITDPGVLDAHARAELAQMRDGLAQLTIGVHLDTGPQVNLDFSLGDNVEVSLTCPRFPMKVGASGDWEAGYIKTVRCIGWELDYEARRLKPMLTEVG